MRSPIHTNPHCWLPFCFVRHCLFLRTIGYFILQHERPALVFPDIWT
jgi:hypothetical protein